MIKQQAHLGHSDHAPSSKDWETGPATSPAGGKPQGTSAQAADRVGLGMKQPGSGAQGPDPDDVDQKLDEALEESFPASDAPAPAQPNITGFDIEDERARGGKR